LLVLLLPGHIQVHECFTNAKACIHHCLHYCTHHQTWNTTPWHPFLVNNACKPNSLTTRLHCRQLLPIANTNSSSSNSSSRLYSNGSCHKLSSSSGYWADDELSSNNSSMAGSTTLATKGSSIQNSSWYDDGHEARDTGSGHWTAEEAKCIFMNKQRFFEGLEDFLRR
jgi:hypothetical protein